jgi:hypothetical protein
VGAEVRDGEVGRGDGFDALALALEDDAYDILGDVLGDGEDAAVADGRVGAEEG